MPHFKQPALDPPSKEGKKARRQEGKKASFGHVLSPPPKSDSEIAFSPKNQHFLLLSLFTALVPFR